MSDDQVAEFKALHSNGMTYSQISKHFNVTTSKVRYWCNRDMFRERDKDPTRKVNEKLRIASTGFNSTRQEILAKFGLQTRCYLSGQFIDLKTDAYHFDHIIPLSKGGPKNINNMGITTPRANQSKADMFLDEYLEHCKQVLEYHGYIVNKIHRSEDVGIPALS